MSEQYNKLYVVSWDMYGIEALVPVTDIEADAIIGTLKGDGKSFNLNQTINSIILRARFNQQRHYEVYYFYADSNLTVDDIKTYFSETPQDAADWVRKNGFQLYSDRVKQDDPRVLIR